MNSSISLQCLVLAAIILLLGACSDDGRSRSSTPVPPPDSAERIEITADNAILLTRASLDVIGKLATIGNITTAMIKDGMGLLTKASHFPGEAIEIPECLSSPDGYGVETNQMSYNSFAPGYLLPAGDSLHVAFSNCTVESVLVTGFVDIAGISITGNPAGASGDWHIQAVISLGVLEFVNGNGSETSFTDTIDYTADMSNGTLTTTLSVAEEPDAGEVGGLNAQHFTDPLTAPSLAINYQLRPFHLVSTDDAGTGQYTVAVQAHPADGASILKRYRINPDTESILRIATTTPIMWLGGRPDEYTDTPAFGEIQFTETDCKVCGNILAVVDFGGVTLTVNDGAAITTQFSSWETLLTTPDYGPSDP